MATDYRYEITARDSALGGGWRLRLLEDGEEVGGGVFPLAEYLAEADGDLVLALDLAHADASGVARDWLESRHDADTGPR
jgi:hypothetical protein